MSLLARLWWGVLRSRFDNIVFESYRKWTSLRIVILRMRFKLRSIKLWHRWLSIRRLGIISRQRSWGLCLSSLRKIWKQGGFTRWSRSIIRKKLIWPELGKINWRLSTIFGTRNWMSMARKGRNWFETCRRSTRWICRVWRTIWRSSCLTRWRKVQNTWTWRRWRSIWPSKNCKLVL